MITSDILTSDESIRLITPDILRDAERNVEWTADEEGRETQKAMGVPADQMQELTLQEAMVIVQTLVLSEKDILWMIEYDGEVVGMIEVHLEPNDYLAAPAITIMIGDPEARGHGVGFTAMQAAIAWLQYDEGEEIIFSRYPTDSRAACRLSQKLGFEEDDEPYTDQSGQQWQNVVLRQ